MCWEVKRARENCNRLTTPLEVPGELEGFGTWPDRVQQSNHYLDFEQLLISSFIKFSLIMHSILEVSSSLREREARRKKYDQWLSPKYPLFFDPGRLSFPPRIHEHCSQEMLECTGNLDGNLSKLSLFDESLTSFN